MAARGPSLPNSVKNKKHLINPQCSFPTCDSLVCFTRRQYEEQCSCHKCQNSKTCLYFPYKPGADADLVNTVKLSIAGDDVAAEERIKREITYEFGEILKTRNVKKYKAKVPGQDNSVAEKDNIKEQVSEQVHNVTINICHEDHNNSSTPNALSAQIKNASYENVHSNDDNKTSEPSSYEISVYDLLGKITDVYKACSCKVCECIVGKSTVPKHKLCKCKPCDCKDCTTFLSKIHYLKGLKTIPPIGCPCVRCTRSQCKGITNRFDEPQICDCPPCNCIKCNESYAKTCKCEPCQCLECKAMSIKGPMTFIVSPVGEQRNYCECSPCECIVCRGYGTTSSYMREAATNVDRHPRCQCATCDNEICITGGSQACKCDRRSRIIAKPIEKDLHDYEIRTVITKNKDFRNTHSGHLRNSTIAMYARVPNLYNNISYQKGCSCDVCECITGNCKQSEVNNIKPSRLIKDIYNVQFASDLATKSCSCSSCECQICSTKISCQNKSKTVAKNCKCEVCDCLNCEGNIKEYKRHLTYVNNNNVQSTKESRKCNPCECHKCSNCITCEGDVCCCPKYSYEQCLQDSNESIYPIKRAKILTPSSFTKQILKKTINNKHSSLCVEDDSKNGSSTKSYNSFGNHNSKRDTIPYSGYPQYYDIINQMKYILPPANGTQMLPKRESLEYIVNNDIPNPNAQKNYENFKISEYVNFVAARHYKDHTIEAVSTESICANGSKENGTLDYFTEFFEVRSAEKLTSQDCNQMKSAHHADSYIEEEKPNAIHGLSNTSYTNVGGNLRCENSSFESDNENYFLKDMAGENCIYYPRKHKGTAYKQLYSHQYWIKNFDVSLTAQDRNLQDNKKYLINNDSRNNLNTNRHRDSDKNISHSYNIGDHSISVCSYRVDNLFCNDAYYDRVQRTLHKARAFSLQLMKTLEKYERANKEFRSLTQKLKLSHTSLVSKNILETSKTVDCNVSLTMSSVNQKNVHEANDIPPKNNQPIGEETSLQLSQSDLRNDVIIKGRCEDFVKSSVLKFSTNSVEGSENFKAPCQNNRGKLNKTKMNEFTMLHHIKIRGVKKSKVKTIKQVVLISKRALNTGALNCVLQTVRSTQTLSHNYEEAATDANSLARIYISTEEEQNLQVEVQKLLKIPLLEQVHNITTNYGVQQPKWSPQSSRSCCDAHKARFLSLRRVSDHTVLVKWTAPRTTRDVKGFELLVDGRAVQKVLSPSRCAAVVTCLPHCDTILLTIRTITSHSASGHFPSSTIVYHPRITQF